MEQLATAIVGAALNLIQAKRVRFLNAVYLVNRLELKKLLSKVSNLAKQLYPVARHYSRKAVVILASPKTCNHSPKDRLVVMIRNVFS